MKRPALALLSFRIAHFGLGLTLASGFPALGADGAQRFPAGANDISLSFGLGFKF